jgi:hypothetical protein
MCSRTVDENGPTSVIHRVDNSIFVGEPQGEEAGKVADQPFSASWVRRQLFLEDNFQLFLQTRREFSNVFDGFFREADGIWSHG